MPGPPRRVCQPQAVLVPPRTPRRGRGTVVPAAAPWRLVAAITVSSSDLITEIPHLGRSARLLAEAKARRAEPERFARAARFCRGPPPGSRVSEACDLEEAPGGCSQRRTMWRSTRLRARGWSVSAIARHTGRDRKTVRKYLAGDGAGQRREPAPSCLEPFRDYIAARFVDDPHVDATVLHRELVEAGFERSYPTLVRGAAAAGAAAGLPGLPAPPRHGGDGRDRAPAGRGDPVGLAGAAPRRRGASRRTCWSARCRTRGASAACSASR